MAKKAKKTRGNNKSAARIEIEVWMLRSGVRVKDLARELRVDDSAISHFLDGRLVSARIRALFVKKGCPEGLLDGLAAAKGDAETRGRGDGARVDDVPAASNG
jgi:hypothetical protein